jgi:hypothetical protein
VSEQDFFFDEEPDAKTPAAKGPASKAAAPKASKQTPSDSGKPASKAVPVVEASPSEADQSTTWAVASLLGVVGLLLGAILGFLLGNSLPGTTTSTTPAPAAVTAPGAAPSTLTSEQINSGELPAGHPPIDASGTAGATGSADTTGQ